MGAIMPKSRIIWTTLEQQRLAAWCAQRVALRLNVDVTELTRETLHKHYGFFTEVFECAQQEVFKQSPERIRPLVLAHSQVSWLLGAMVSFVQKQQRKRYAKQDHAEDNPARTVALSAQDLSKLCAMVTENVVKQLAERYGLSPISIPETAVGNTGRRKNNS